MYLGVIALLAASLPAHSADSAFRFVIHGDRTGSAQPGVYEQVWRETAELRPSFVINTGDIIEGANDALAESEWRDVKRIVAPYERFRLFLIPGNHDVWSAQSESLFRKYAGHGPRYSFDVESVHVSVLDNSRGERFSSEDLEFLERDLARSIQPVKLIFSHRPSWLMDVVLQNASATFHQIARKNGVRHVVSGHVHQLLRFEFDGITYLSMPSAGGHLRGSKKYEDGWFFGYTVVDTKGSSVSFQVRELNAPNGKGRVTDVGDWGAAGLTPKPGQTRR